MTLSKTICLSALALSVSGAAITSAVRADDLSGTRIAIHSDYLWGKAGTSGFTNAGATLKSYDVNGNGLGLEVIHDWQSGDTVYGAFGNFSAMDLTGGVSVAKVTTDTEGASVTTHHGFDTDLKWLAAVGGRVGHVVNDNTLIYAQAGVASGRIEIRETGDGATANGDITKSGYMAGVGVDLQIGEHSWVGVNFNHYDLGEINFAPAAYDAGRISVSGTLMMARLGYRF